jgi:hypothetical protein
MKIEIPIIPFNGESKIEINKKDYHSWCLTEIPTHLVCEQYWDEGLKIRWIACSPIKCKTKKEASERALSNTEKGIGYGNFYWYSSDIRTPKPWRDDICGYVVHFPRFESENLGFVNFHQIKSGSEFEKIENYKKWFYK